MVGLGDLSCLSNLNDFVILWNTGEMKAMIQTFPCFWFGKLYFPRFLQIEEQFFWCRFLRRCSSKTSLWPDISFWTTIFRINVTWKKILWPVRQFLLALHNVKSCDLFTFKTCKIKEWTNGEGLFLFAEFLIYTDFLIYFLKMVSVHFLMGVWFSAMQIFLNNHRC